MTAYRIPFNRPYFTGREPEHIRTCLEQGHISGDGPLTLRCQALLEEILEAPTVLLTTSCTHALELAAMLLDVGPGDDVVLPSYTFVSTANAFVLRGARPVFVDIVPDTLNLDPVHLETLVSERTSAIVPVHYAGIGCDMPAILDIAARHGSSVVEDAALGLFSRSDERYLGTFGRLATFSFHETKSYSAGEGGAIVVNDESLVERAEILREKGTNRSKFFRGEVDKYTWVDAGSSYLPSDIIAALLFAQLEAREEIRAMRNHIWDRYRAGLEPWAKEHGVRLPHVPLNAEPVPAMFYVVLPSEASRRRVIDALKHRGILAVFHYVPLHLSPMGRRFGGEPGQLPVTEDVSERILRLPFYNELRDDDVDEIVDIVSGVSV
jgi:dTDP-4-amino-4,6-dideoxygalactose transaminase